MIQNIELTLGPRARDCRAVLDGVDLSNGVSGVTVKHKLGDIPLVELHLPIAHTEIDGHAKVIMHEETRRILTTFGWTPPGEPSELAPLAKAIRELIDVIDDMATRNTDLDAAAGTLRGELVDLGWTESEIGPEEIH